MSALIVPAIAWAIHMSWSLTKIKDSQLEHSVDNIEKLDKLLEMHYNPDAYGFGTNLQTKVIENNTRIMKEVVYYLKWDAQKNKMDIPPYIEDA